MVRCCVALHRLPHNVRMNARPVLPGIIERLEDAIDAPLIKLPIQLRKPQIKAYKQRTFHAVDGEKYEPVARRQPTQILLCAKSLIVSVSNLALAIYKIETIMRLARWMCGGLVQLA